MADLILQVADDQYIYRIVLSNDHQHKISETAKQTGHTRAYKINRKSVNCILRAPEDMRFNTAANVYRDARLKKARKTNRAGGGNDQLVSPV